MALTRIPGCLLMATALALAPAAAAAQADAPEPRPAEPELEETATGVELFDYVEGVAGATGEILEAEAAADRGLRAGPLRVGDLEGRAVLGANDEAIGEIGRILRQDGTVWAVIEEGGLGAVGDAELPVELGRIRVTPDHELRVPHLSEEQVEAAADVDLGSAEDLPPDMPLTQLRD